MKIINLTPHSVTVAGITIKPSGVVARISSETVDAGSLDFNGTKIPLTPRHTARCRGSLTSATTQCSS